MKILLIAKALVETLAGFVFAVFPSTFIYLTLGEWLREPEGVVGVRMFGVAAFAIGLACWLAQNDIGSIAARALVMALLVYDLVFITILLAARFEVGLSGLLLWPIIALHLTLAGLSIHCLKSGRAQSLGNNQLPAQ